MDKGKRDNNIQKCLQLKKADRKQKIKNRQKKRKEKEKEYIYIYIYIKRHRKGMGDRKKLIESDREIGNVSEIYAKKNS